MNNLFLASSFKDVAGLLKAFAGEELNGKTITFIPTASIPEPIKFYVGSARKALEKLGLTVDLLEVTKETPGEIRKKLESNDYIYVSGGNTFYLLQELKRSGADKAILEQINNGKLYVGESAGAIILAPDIEYVKAMDDAKKATELDVYAAMHVVDFYPLPHYTNFPFKKSVEKIIKKYEEALPLYPFSNSQAIVVHGEEISLEKIS